MSLGTGGFVDKLETTGRFDMQNSSNSLNQTYSVKTRKKYFCNPQAVCDLGAVSVR